MRFFDLTQKDQQANDNLLEKYFSPETIAVIKEDIYASENILTPQDEGGVFIFPLPSEDA